MVNPINYSTRTILHLEWDVTVLLEWLDENKRDLPEEECPVHVTEGSISKTIFEFYETLPDGDPDDQVLDHMYNYRERHGLKFALRGTDIPDIYIGKVGDNYTISRYDDKEQWCCQINLHAFFKSLSGVVR